MSWGFEFLLTAVTIGTLGYIAWFIVGARKNDRRWVNENSRDTYVRTADTLIASSGIAVALLMTPGRTSTPRWILHRAIASLVISIVFTVFFILILVRNAEVAISPILNSAPRRKSRTKGESVP